MTQEMLLGLTGMKQVGEGKSMRRVGMLFGYPVEATSPQKGKTLTLAFTAGSPRFKLKELRNKLREDDELTKRVTVSNTPSEDGRANVFLVAITPPKESDAQSLYARALERLEEALKELPTFEPPTACPFCSSDGGDTLATHNGTLSPVHRNCLDKWKQDEEGKIERKKNNPSGPIGLIGGLLGGLVGALPALIVLWFFDYFVFILFALIPAGIVVGWRLFGGAVTRGTTVFVILYTLIVATLTVIVHAYLVLYDVWGGGVTLMETLVWFFDPNWFFDFFARDTGLALVSAVVGIFFSWRFVTATDAGDLALIQTIYDEAVPIE